MIKNNQFLKLIKLRLWTEDLYLRRGSWLFIVITIIAMSIEIYGHKNGYSLLNDVWNTNLISVFFNVPSVHLSDLQNISIANQLINLSIIKILFGILVGFLDIIFYQKITKKRFNYNLMIHFSIINGIFLLIAVILPKTTPIATLLFSYEELLKGIPHLLELNGVTALIIACFIADFCFYWSHRWGHTIRLFWNVGHIHHHKSDDLTQFTYAIDPQFSILNVAGGKSFVLLMLPLIGTLFTTEISSAGWFLTIVLCVDLFLGPSHSIVLYYVESKLYKSKKTRMLIKIIRFIFVTNNTHYTHHSSEKRHDISNGCNFAARISLIDRLFGTYCTPPLIPPKTGIYGNKPEYDKTPLRFIVNPWVVLLKELYLNNFKNWGQILFGKASYKPPVKV